LQVRPSWKGATFTHVAREALMRGLAVLAVALLLGGCNVVVTEKPLLTAADERGAPPLRPGLWRMEDPKCPVDEALPLDQWPECAGGAVMSPGQMAGYDHKDGKAIWQRIPLVLAAGSPRIAQVAMNEEPPTPSEPAKGYGYAAVKPMKFDPQHRITLIRYWIVQCGPPPPQRQEAPKSDRLPALGTLHPLPGMKMKPGEAVCTTDSVKALRAAAKASEAWDDEHHTAHWVRDGER
jgi:hypothetical protein